MKLVPRYDLDRKSQRDLRNFHAGCPILKGSKWIFNKWILSFDQFRTRPCSLNPHEEMKPPTGFY